MEYDFGPDPAGLFPADSLAGPKAMLTWALLLVALGVMAFSVKLLPRAHPVRVFVEGMVAMILGAVTSTPSRGRAVVD